MTAASDATLVPRVFVTNDSNLPISVTSASAVTTVTSADKTLSNVSSVALAANTSAVYRVFQNTDATIIITLGLGATPTSLVGVVLRPGDSYEMSSQIGNLFKGVVNAIAASGSPVLAVSEGV